MKYKQMLINLINKVSKSYNKKMADGTYDGNIKNLFKNEIMSLGYTPQQNTLLELI